MRKLFLLLLLCSLAILIATPAAADEETADEGTAQKQEHAQKIYKQYGCNECHAISALKMGVDLSAIEEDDDWDDDEDEEAFTPDLSNVGLVRDAKWISMWLRKKIDIDGVKHKKRFQGNKEERQALALWLETLKYELPEGVGVEMPSPEAEQETP